MLGVIWGDTDYGGDGERVPVRVRGTDGVASPITVFQQIIPDRLGTVISWEEDGVNVGLFGRQWDASRTDELVALANALTRADGRYALPSSALPDGYEEVYQGPPGAGIVGAYSVVYGSAGSIERTAVTSTDASQAQFESILFLAPHLSHIDTTGRDTISGSLFAPGALPFITMWREPDGLVVSVTSWSADRAAFDRVAADVRELDRAEWLQLLSQKDSCKRPEVPTFSDLIIPEGS